MSNIVTCSHTDQYSSMAIQYYYCSCHSHTRSLLITPPTNRDFIPNGTHIACTPFALRPTGSGQKWCTIKELWYHLGSIQRVNVCVLFAFWSLLSVQRNYSKAMSQTPVQKTTPRGSGRTKLPAILSVI